jgi:hypothetical protein
MVWSDYLNYGAMIYRETDSGWQPGIGEGVRVRHYQITWWLRLEIIKEQIMAKWIWGIGIASYVVPAICMAIYIVSHDLSRPVLGGLLWPIRLAKILLGGG